MSRRVVAMGTGVAAAALVVAGIVLRGSTNSSIAFPSSAHFEAARGPDWNQMARNED
jgi:hypothetical protein